MIKIVDMNSRRNPFGVSEFVMPVKRIAERLEPCSVVHYSEITHLKPARCSRVIITGTALMDHESLEKGDFKWLETIQRPVLGICAGMQAIAKHFGSPMTRYPEIGMHKIQPVVRNRILRAEINAYLLHTVGVRPSRNFDVIAGSSRCAYAIKHREKEIYGVMFHPEVRNPEIIENFISL